MVAHTLNGVKGSGRQAFSLLRERVGRYWKVARLVLSDSVWRFRWRLAAVLLVSSVSLSLQGGALGAFVFYARRLESGDSVEIAGLAVDPRSFALLAVAIIAGGALFVLASFLRLYVQRSFYDITWRYGVYCAERMLTLASAALHQTGHDGIPLGEAELREMVTSRPVLCSRVLNRLINSLPLASNMVVYSGFLFYLDPTLTVAVLMIVLVSSFFFYGLSVEASRFIPAREEKTSAMSADYQCLLDFMRVSSRPLAPDHPLLQRLVRHGSFAAFFAQRFRPQVFAAQSAHVGSIVMAGVLTVVVLVKGGQIIVRGTGFGDLLVFLIAGRLAMGSVTAIMSALVRINLYYPPVAGYFRMVERLRAATGADAASGPSTPGRPLQVTAKPLGNQASVRAPRILPGQRLGLVTPKLLDRFALIEVAGGLRLQKDGAKRGERRVAPAQCWLVHEALPAASALSFADIAGLPGDVDAASLSRELGVLGISPEAGATVPDDLFTPMDAQAWDRVDPSALWGAALVAAGRAGHPVVAVGARTLDAIGETAARTVFDRLLAARLMLIAYRPGEAKRAGEFGERYVLLYDGKSLLGYLSVEEVASKLDFIEGMERARKTKDEMGDDVLMDGDV